MTSFNSNLKPSMRANGKPTVLTTESSLSNFNDWGVPPVGPKPNPKASSIQQTSIETAQNVD